MSTRPCSSRSPSAAASTSARCASGRSASPRPASWRRSCSTAPTRRPPTARGGSPWRAGCASWRCSGSSRGASALAALAAVRPWGGAALAVQRQRALVLLGLGGRGGVAAAAELLPGGAVELVLAAVGAVGRDRGRVAAGLALGDPLKRRARVAPGGGRRAARRRRVRGDAERSERPGADDAVDGQAVAALEAAHGRPGAGAVDDVGGNA